MTHSIDTPSLHCYAIPHHLTHSSLLSLWLCLLFFFCLVSSNSSFSTFSISETSNQTPLVCALIPSSGGRTFLNCTSQFIPVKPNVSFSGIVSGDGFLCTLRCFSLSSSAMHCWRFSGNGSNLIYKRIHQGSAIQQLEAGNSHICGIVNRANSFQCWQWNEFNTNSIREKFSSIAVGEDFVCGLSATGKISCFGTANDIFSSINKEQTGNYNVIAAGFRHVCAISLGGDLNCWGDSGGRPQGKFLALALGENRSCAMRQNRTVVCWGENDFSLPTSLQGDSFISIEAKRSVFCGVLKEAYSLFCWGNEIFGSGSMVFKEVLPGSCTNTCPCVLPGSGKLCAQGQQICWPCETETPPTPLGPSPQPQPRPESRSSGWNGKMVAFLVVGCFGSFVFVLVCVFFLYKHCKFRGCRIHDSGPLDEAAAAGQQEPSQRQNPQPHPPLPLPLPPVLEKKLSQLTSMGNAGHLKEFPLQILLEATNNFSEDRKIGSGSFGSVYRATLDDGRQVAVKRAEVSCISSYAIGTKLQEDKDRAFINELESLSRLHHKNLVRLLGFCEEHKELVLVFEYMENGTLNDHLHKLQTSSPIMSWPFRIKVALDAAKGIEYLHEYAVPSIIHRDIKSSNILLDATGTAKVSDFGLSLVGPDEDESHLSLPTAGTVGYMDPQYYRLQQLTKKSDVYSFGVVLLELLSGYKAIHRNENGVPRNVVDFAVPYIVRDEIHRVLDPKMPPPTPYEMEAVAYVGYLAVDCVTLEGRDRPSMTEIVNCLERALTACLVLPSLSRSSTASST